MPNTQELVRELQEMRDQGYLSDALLRYAVKSIAESDERFDWVGAFLLRESGENLWLHNYVGAPAERAEVPVGEGVCGTAVSEKSNQNVADVTEMENHLACNPDARSELVVLIRAGDDIFGELAIDNEDVGAFTDEDESVVQAVADKLAEQIAAERR